MVVVQLMQLVQTTEDHLNVFVNQVLLGVVQFVQVRISLNKLEFERNAFLSNINSDKFNVYISAR
jgi:hypothetical protein